MKKILILLLSFSCYSAAYAENPVMISAGIYGFAGNMGEMFPDDSDDDDSYSSDDEKSLIKGGYDFEAGFYYDLKFIQPGEWFHEFYLSYGRSKGQFDYEDDDSKFRNNFTADTFTAMYRIGGFIHSMDDVYVNDEGTYSYKEHEDSGLLPFGYLGLGLALDRYRSGPFSDETNGMMRGKPYIVRPVFGIGGGFIYKNLIINVAELRFDVRFQKQPQEEFQDYLDQSHWIGAIGLYSSIGVSF